jgi:hypothetical protein
LDAVNVSQKLSGPQYLTVLPDPSLIRAKAASLLDSDRLIRKNEIFGGTLGIINNLSFLGRRGVSAVIYTWLGLPDICVRACRVHS